MKKLIGQFLVVIGIITIIFFHSSNDNISLIQNPQNLFLMIENFLLAYNEANLLFYEKTLIDFEASASQIVFLIKYLTTDYLPYVISPISRVIIVIGVIFVFSQNGLINSTITALKNVIIGFLIVFLLSNFYDTFNNFLSSII